MFCLHTAKTCQMYVDDGCNKRTLCINCLRLCTVNVFRFAFFRSCLWCFICSPLPLTELTFLSHVPHAPHAFACTWCPGKWDHQTFCHNDHKAITNLSILFTQSDVLELLILHELCLRERNTSLELCLTHLDRWDWHELLQTVIFGYCCVNFDVFGNVAVDKLYDSTIVVRVKF